MNIQKGSIVTVEIAPQSSHTFIVDTDEGASVLVRHPLAGPVLLRFLKSDLNKVGASVKDSTDRCLDFATSNKKFLDYSTQGDLEGVGIYFSIKRQLTPRQKQILANICGVIASVKFNNDLKEAMYFVTKHSSILDDFNMMWFNNFQGLFSGRQPITSKKQRNAIFNIAGYVLAELETPTTPKHK